MGYDPKWIQISRKRIGFFNTLLQNSAKRSQHLLGKAIDVWVIDIDSDNKFNLNDINIIIKANKRVESNHPSLKGGIGYYIKKDFLSRRMIHFDTRGKSVIFEK